MVLLKILDLILKHFKPHLEDQICFFPTIQIYNGKAYNYLNIWPASYQLLKNIPISTTPSFNYPSKHIATAVTPTFKATTFLKPHPFQLLECYGFYFESNKSELLA